MIQQNVRVGKMSNEAVKQITKRIHVIVVHACKCNYTSDKPGKCNCGKPLKKDSES